VQHWRRKREREREEGRKEGRGEFIPVGMGLLVTLSQARALMEISCCYISHVVVSGGPGGSFRCFKLDNHDQDQEIINAGQINDQSTMDENKYASRYVHRLANPKIVSMFQLSILYIYTVKPLASSFRIIWFINVETGVSENVSRRCGIGIIMEDIANCLSLQTSFRHSNAELDTLAGNSPDPLVPIHRGRRQTPREKLEVSGSLWH
jgi:hypothetical protein